MEKSMFRAVVFDFDYTLADSSAGVVECTTYALRSLGLPLAPESRMRQSIGLSLAATLEYLTGITDPDVAAEFTRTFVQRADQVMADLAVVYATVPGVITALRSAGFTLGIVSTKFRYRIENILTREGLLTHFDVIVGGEDVSRHKPHPAGLLRALDCLTCVPEQTVYVGDHPVDAEAASRAKVPFVAVLSGTSAREHFAPHQPLGIVDDVSGLPRLLDV